MTAATRTSDAIARLAREDSGRVLALLARRFGDLDVADDAVQDALAEAVATWPRVGIPDNPPAWLYTVALRKGIDRMRREASARRRTLASAHELTREPDADDEEDDVIDNGFSGDEQLRLILLCCHPALDRQTQVALTLRLVGGLTTDEIAAAYLVPVATIAQRIVRAKRKIRDAGMPLTIPREVSERLGVVLAVLYLVFNESYLARGAGEAVARVDLADEAIRLTRQLHELVPEVAEVEGLLALQLYVRARSGTRQDDDGELVLLEDQDRSSWDRGLIEEADRVLVSALARMSPGAFQLQAVIAACHSTATTAAETDWRRIVTAYDQLFAMTGSPVVAINRAVAVGMAEGPEAGLLLADDIDGLDGYHLLHAARGELLARSGRLVDAIAELRRALELTANVAEQRHLERRIRDLALDPA